MNDMGSADAVVCRWVYSRDVFLFILIFNLAVELSIHKVFRQVTGSGNLVYNIFHINRWFLLFGDFHFS